MAMVGYLAGGETQRRDVRDAPSLDQSYAFLSYFGNLVIEFPLTYHDKLVDRDPASGEKTRDWFEFTDRTFRPCLEVRRHHHDHFVATGLAGPSVRVPVLSLAGRVPFPLLYSIVSIPVFNFNLIPSRLSVQYRSCMLILAISTITVIHATERGSH